MTALLLLLSLAPLAASQPGPAAREQTAAEAAKPAVAARLPAQVDLRPAFASFGLTPKNQGPRGCCSLFALTGVLEYEFARATGKPVRLSEEFLNWASHQSNGRRTDGSFFSDALRGLAMLGICRQDLLPYADKFNPDLKPSPEALADALTRRDVSAHWIKVWDVKTGMTPEMLEAMRRTLAGGHPVAIGQRWPDHEQWDAHNTLVMPPEGKVFDGHSTVFVGYRDDPAEPGGGVFLFRNSFGADWHDAGYAWMPYAYPAAYGNDAVGVTIGDSRPLPSNRTAVAPVEVEGLDVVLHQGCSASTQNMSPWGAPLWSGGKQLFCQAEKGATLTLRLPVARAGEYEVDLYATRAPDYARLRVALDGVALGGDIDLYGPEVLPTGRIALGVVRLAAGYHKASFRVDGRNAASSGWRFGLDCLDLRPVARARK